MHVSRSVFDVEMAVKKLNSRLRRPPQLFPSQWPVISATRPLFYLIRLFGLAPFQICENHFIPGGYDVIYSFLCSLIHTYSLYTVLNKFAAVDRRETAILDITETAKVIFNYCVAMFNILVAVWTRKEFIEVLNVVKNFDSKIRDLGHPRKEVAAKIWVWSIFVCGAFLWITINRTGMVAFGETWLYNITYILNYIATALSTIKFSSVVFLLGQRFAHLNRIAQYSQKSGTTGRKYIPVNHEVIQQLHNSLMNAGEILSSQYSWSLLLWLSNLCVHSVSNLYFLIDWLMVTSEWVVTRWSLVKCITWWLVIFIVQLLLLHVACDFTSAEANSLGSIVINWKSAAVGRNHGLEYSLYLLNRKLNFSAAGCFCVDLPLLSSISGLLATYLVILLQTQT